VKIRYKTTLLFTLLVTTILLILNLFIYYSTSQERKDFFSRRLKSRASNNAQVYDYFGDSSLKMLQRMDASSLSILPRKTVSLYDTLGRVLYRYVADSNLDAGADSSLLADVRQTGEENFTDGERDGLAMYYKGERKFIIVVAAYDADGRQRLAELKKLLVISLFLGMLVTLITGFVFSTQLVQPIKTIIDKVNDISSRDLSKRVPVGKSEDELNQLAKTFNRLLERLEESFATQRRFISNASHELSTPLTSISSQLQVTLQKERSSADYQAVLQSIQEDVEQMRQLTKSLLEIARTGAQGSIELHDLRIDELLMKVIADIQRINPAYRASLEFPDLPFEEKQCMVFGNFDLLYSSFKNIIENGCKYAIDKTSMVKISFDKNEINIHVINHGDIITKQDAEQIFQPFFRGSNAGDNEGFGLGLPLAKRIIAIHKGNITVKSDYEGTEFIISLPSLKATLFNPPAANSF
jgi:two-component system sensor histidine kinase ArlS